MHYEIVGQGEPLVMLHAWSGNGREQIEQIAGFLNTNAAGFSKIALEFLAAD